MVCDSQRLALSAEGTRRLLVVVIIVVPSFLGVEATKQKQAEEKSHVSAAVIHTINSLRFFILQSNQTLGSPVPPEEHFNLFI